ncbi:MAG: radical SAM protein [Candidatus Omnitrophota bacterium]
MNKFKKNIKKVLLIFPPVVCSNESPKQIMPPLGISYLGAYLEPYYEVKLLDAALEGYNYERRVCPGFFQYGLSDEKIKKIISEFLPDVVGVSCLYSSQFPAVANICSIAKAVSSEIITFIGGTHPTFLPRECLEYKTIDFITLGEGELPAKALLDALNHGTSYEKLDGLAYRSDNSIYVNPQKRIIEDIDTLPFPARHLLPLEKYFRIGLPMGLVSRQTPAINIVTSRGCPFNCSFCSSCHFWSRRYRTRSVKNVLAEMEELKKMGVRELKFFDDNLTLDKQRAKDLFKSMIARKFNFTWNTPNGIAAQTLDEELLILMKDSGCYEVTLAIESGDERVLKDVLKKPIDLTHTLAMAKLIKKHRMDTYGFFIIGFPQETKKQIYNTLAFINKIKLDRISLFIANPLPGTEIYDICKKEGYLPETVTGKSLDYFSSVFATPEFDSAFLEKIRRRWYWEYNLKLLLRNPFKFFQKYSIFIIKRPLFMLRILINKIIMPSISHAKCRTAKNKI